MKRLLLFTTALLLLASISFAQNKKPLRNTWYSYKQLTKRGYNVQPFKGKIFITYKKYLEINRL